MSKQKRCKNLIHGKEITILATRTDKEISQFVVFRTLGLGNV